LFNSGIFGYIIYITEGLLKDDPAACVRLRSFDIVVPYLRNEIAIDPEVGMYWRRLRKSKKGMTIVEVMVSFAIIAIVLVMVLAVLTTSANVKVKGDAFTLADEQLSKAIAEGATDSTVDGITVNNTGENNMAVVVGEKKIVIPGQVYEYDDDEYDKTFRIVGPKDSK
jgi:hypothetical protein